jgi:hypothetical protein
MLSSSDRRPILEAPIRFAKVSKCNKKDPPQIYLPPWTLQKLPDHPSPYLELETCLTGISGSEERWRWVYAAEAIYQGLIKRRRPPSPVSPITSHHSSGPLITKLKWFPFSRESIVFTWIDDPPLLLSREDRMSSQIDTSTPCLIQGGFY